MKLCSKNKVSEVFEFDSSVNVLIVGGSGSVALERSIDGSDFYPLSTNISGGIAKFKLNGECAYNGILTHGAVGCKYRFVGDIEEGEVEIKIARVR